MGRREESAVKEKEREREFVERVAAIVSCRGRLVSSLSLIIYRIFFEYC